MNAQYSPGGGSKINRLRPSATDFYDTPSSPLRVETNLTHLRNRKPQDKRTPLSIKGVANVAMRNFSERRSPPRGPPRRYRDDTGGSSGGSSPFSATRRPDDRDMYQRRSRSPNRYDERDRRFSQVGSGRLANGQPNDYWRPMENTAAREDRDRASRARTREFPRNSRSPVRGRDIVNASETSSRNSSIQEPPIDCTPLQLPHAHAVPSKTPSVKASVKAPSTQGPNLEHATVSSQICADAPPQIDQSQLVNDAVKSLAEIMLRLTSHSTVQASLTLEQQTAKKRLEQYKGELRKSEIYHKSFPSSLVQQKASVDRAERSVRELSERLVRNKAEVEQDIEMFAAKVISTKLVKDNVSYDNLQGRCDALEKCCASLRKENDELKAKSQELETKYDGQQLNIQAIQNKSAKPDEEALAKIRNDVNQLQKTFVDQQEAVVQRSQVLLKNELAPILQSLKELEDSHNTIVQKILEDQLKAATDLKEKLDKLEKLPRSVEDLWKQVEEVPILRQQLEETKEAIADFPKALSKSSEAGKVSAQKERLDQQEQVVAQQGKALAELDFCLRGNNNQSSLQSMILQSARNEERFRNKLKEALDKIASLETQVMSSDVVTEKEKSSCSATPLMGTPKDTSEVLSERRLVALEKEIRNTRTDADCDKEMLALQIDNLRKQVSSVLSASPAGAESVCSTMMDRIREYQDFVDGQKGHNSFVEDHLQQNQTWRDSTDVLLEKLKEQIQQTTATRNVSLSPDFESFREEQTRTSAQLKGGLEQLLGENIQRLEDRLANIIKSQHTTDSMLDSRLREAEGRADSAIIGLTSVTNRVDNINTGDLARHMIDQLSEIFPHARNANEGLIELRMMIAENHKELRARIDDKGAQINDMRAQINSSEKQQQDLIGTPRRVSETRTLDRQSPAAFRTQKSLRQEVDTIAEDHLKAAGRQKTLESTVLTIQMRCDDHDRQLEQLRSDLDGVVSQQPARPLAPPTAGADRNVEAISRSTPTGNHDSVTASHSGSRQSSVTGSLTENRKRKATNGVSASPKPQNGNPLKRPRPSHNTGFIEESDDEAVPEVHLNEESDSDAQIWGPVRRRRRP